MVQRNTSTETQRRRHTAPTRKERERHQNDSQDDEIQGVRTIEVSHKMTRLEIRFSVPIVVPIFRFLVSSGRLENREHSDTREKRNRLDVTRRHGASRPYCSLSLMVGQVTTLFIRVSLGYINYTHAQPVSQLILPVSPLAHFLLVSEELG